MSFAVEKITGSKQEFYAALVNQIEHLLAGERDCIANLANASALLWMQLDNINWPH